MKIICTALGVYIYLVISLSLIIFETEGVPMENCTSPGQQIGDTDNNTEFYICLPNGADYTYYPQTCPPGGIFVPDPINAGCVEQQETTTTTESTTTEKEEITTELPSSTPESVTTELATSTPKSVTTELPDASTTEGDIVAITTESADTTTEEVSSTASDDSSTTESPPVSPTEPSLPSTEPPAVYTCPAEGKYPDPVEPCTRFYQCVEIGGIWYFYVYTCPPGTNYNPSAQMCTISPCSTGTTTTVAPPNATTTTMAPPTTTTTTAVPPTTTTTTGAPPPTTTTPPAGSCPSVGKFPVEGNCMSYYQCLLVNSIWYSFTYTCPPTTYYDATKTLCMAGVCPATNTTTTTTTAVSITSNTVTSQTSSTPSPGYVCPSEGKFQDPFSCSAYYQCIQISGSWYTYKYTCPAGTHWDSVAVVCKSGAC